MNTTTRQFVEKLLGERSAECLAWLKANNRDSCIDRADWKEDSNLLTAKNIISQWEEEVKNIAYWSERLPEDIPELENNTVVTVGELHEYLTKLMVLHPDVAKMPVYHAECHSDVEASYVGVNIKGGFLLVE